MPERLAVLGTGSDVGKTLVVAGLCRQLAAAGRRVVPFKAQNMATNSEPALCGDGGWGEIGTGQALQAAACGLVPDVRMNPVLLKPDAGAMQVVVNGRAIARETWRDYGARVPGLRRLAVDALRGLERDHEAECTLIEGAGSCVELNLWPRELGNLSLVDELACPWILVADIDRGGVYAQIVGVRELVGTGRWSRCRAVVVNRLRGEEAFFRDGAVDLAARCGVPVHVVPHLSDLVLSDEDAFSLDRRAEVDAPPDPDRRNLVAVRLPHVAMTADLLPCEHDPAWRVHWHGEPPAWDADAVVIPGSKSSLADAAWLLGGPWSAWLRRHVDAGRPLLGICGGCQILGHEIRDDAGVDGEPGRAAGLALLPFAVCMDGAKRVAPRRAAFDRIAVAGYEIRHGRLGADDDALLHRAGSVVGTHLHGILATAAARRALLGAGEEVSGGDPFDRWAAHLATHGVAAVRCFGRAAGEPGAAPQAAPPR